MSSEGQLATKVRTLGDKRKALLAELDDVTDELSAAALELADLPGMSESKVAEMAGVGRTTLRVWRGKDASWHQQKQRARRS